MQCHDCKHDQAFFFCFSATTMDKFTPDLSLYMNKVKHFSWSYKIS
jgi:hypothetical protein